MEPEVSNKVTVKICASFMLLVACVRTVSAADTPVPTPPKKGADLWSLKPVVRPPVPAAAAKSSNPIDNFIVQKLKEKGLGSTGPADKLALLRRVYMNLIGIPPSPSEQQAFLNDGASDAYEKVVDKLLAGDQYGVRYGRHWLDVLRYADADERMLAAPGIHMWRDWVISSLNHDLPYDQFVRGQLTGYRTNERTQMSATGYRAKLEPRPDDVFALGFLARGDVIRDNHEVGELPITAVETVSTAFMGMTVGCAKCHDHMYDPIKQRDFYSMKALFDSLVVKKVILASPAEITAHGKAMDEYEVKRAAIQASIDAMAAPYEKKLYDERVAMTPPDVQAIVRKAEKDRTPAEQKIADDYFPVLRIDSGPLKESMPPDVAEKYTVLTRKLNQEARRPADLPATWTVEVDGKREAEKSYILTSGDVDRPEKSHEVQPGWPFAPGNIDFRSGRVDAFAEWLTAPENPFFARVAVNRLWQWSFGEGIQKTSSDFGKLGGNPSNQALLDWLASEFVAKGYSMKALTRLIVTSETYKKSSEASPEMISANNKIDPGNDYFWRFNLQRLEAEPIWDSILSAAGNLDTSVGGRSFDPMPQAGGRGGGGGGGRGAPVADNRLNRRGAYMLRGYSPNRDIVPNFLSSFDVDDGRVPCPMRTQTVTAPQSLFMMNSSNIETASTQVAERVKKEASGDLAQSVDLEYELTLSRPPSPVEKDHALTFIESDPAKLKNLAWVLFNLDEFIYVR
jgi:hypothetical protein